MYKLLVVVVAAVLCLGAVVYFVMPSEASVEEQTAFGSWKTDMTINYVDGETDTLQIASPLFSLLKLMSSSGKEVESVTYTLYAKATGKGYTACEFDFTQFAITPQAKHDGQTTNIEPTGSTFSDMLTVELGDTFHEVGSMQVSAISIETALDFSDTGKLFFTNSGTIRFKGIPNGETAQATLPSSPWMDVTIYEIDVDFTDDPQTDPADPTPDPDPPETPPDPDPDPPEDPPYTPPSTETHDVHVSTPMRVWYSTLVGDGYSEELRTCKAGSGIVYEDVPVGEYVISVRDGSKLCSISFYLDTVKAFKFELMSNDVIYGREVVYLGNPLFGFSLLRTDQTVVPYYQDSTHYLGTI